MAFSLNLPTLSVALRRFYPMKIYQNETPTNILPCDIMELTESKQYEIPAVPVDNGTAISDTFYKIPKSVSVSIYIRANEYDICMSLIESWQVGKGFTIVGVDRQKYNNMYYTDLIENQTPDVVGAYIINMNFREVIKIGSFSVGITQNKVKKAGNTSKVNTGTVNTQEKPTSALKSLANRFSK